MVSASIQLFDVLLMRPSSGVGQEIESLLQWVNFKTYRGQEAQSWLDALGEDQVLIPLLALYRGIQSARSPP